MMKQTSTVCKVALSNLLVLLFSISLAAVSPAEEAIEKGLELAVMGKPLPENFFDGVDRDLLEKSSESDHRAQFLMAKVYEWGTSAETADVKKAEQLYTRSAESGYAPAQSSLGDLWSNHKALGKTDEDALVWHKKAAAQKFAWSYASLARIYGVGNRSVRQDKQAKDEWMQKALESDSPLAKGRVKAQLGYEYQYGSWKKDRDVKKAVELYNEAIELGASKGAEYLGHVYFYGAEGIKKNQKKARAVYLQGAEMGNRMCMSQYGDACLRGYGGPKAPKEAIKWYEKGANLGSSSSMLELSGIYLRGRLVPRNQEKALLWAQRAVDADYIRGYYQLGLYYQKGWAGLKKDLDKAIELYQKAAMYKNASGWVSYPPAVESLAMVYLGRDGYKRDASKALRWLNFSQSPACKYELGCLYRDGEAVETDLEKAFALFKDAAKRGNKKAMVEVANAYREGHGVDVDQAEAKQWQDRADQNRSGR
ncbi:tetratricopeptide repeat protein [Rubritalea halochordaticola]